jgi:hypothetical protein
MLTTSGPDGLCAPHPGLVSLLVGAVWRLRCRTRRRTFTSSAEVHLLAHDGAPAGDPSGDLLAGAGHVLLDHALRVDLAVRALESLVLAGGEPSTAEAPVAGKTPAPVAGETPAPVAGETPASVAGETPASVAADSSTLVAPETPAPVAADSSTLVAGETPTPVVGGWAAGKVHATMILVRPGPLEPLEHDRDWWRSWLVACDIVGVEPAPIYAATRLGWLDVTGAEPVTVPRMRRPARSR